MEAEADLIGQGGWCWGEGGAVSGVGGWFGGGGLTNVLPALHCSRRAETEADLIGEGGRS